MDDDECIHGLDPATCSICRAKARAAAAGPPARPAGRTASTRPSAGRPSLAKPAKPPAASRPSTKLAPTHLAGRKEYFGSDEPVGVWWIDQTGRHEEEWAEGVVTAERPVGGAVPAASRNVGEVRAGDVTLHVVRGELLAVGLATGDGRATSGPPPGWLAEVAVQPLRRAVEVRDLPGELKPGPPGPFTLQGFAQPGTCYPFAPAVARRLARRLRDALPEEHPLQRLDPPAPE